jgi:hypothetical protein
MPASEEVALKLSGEIVDFADVAAPRIDINSLRSGTGRIAMMSRIASATLPMSCLRPDKFAPSSQCVS